MYLRFENMLGCFRGSNKLVVPRHPPFITFVGYEFEWIRETFAIVVFRGASENLCEIKRERGSNAGEFASWFYFLMSFQTASTRDMRKGPTRRPNVCFHKISIRIGATFGSANPDVVDSAWHLSSSNPVLFAELRTKTTIYNSAYSKIHQRCGAI